MSPPANSFELVRLEPGEALRPRCPVSSISLSPDAPTSEDDGTRSSKEQALRFKTLYHSSMTDPSGSLRLDCNGNVACLTDEGQIDPIIPNSESFGSEVSPLPRGIRKASCLSSFNFESTYFPIARGLCVWLADPVFTHGQVFYGKFNLACQAAVGKCVSEQASEQVRRMSEYELEGLRVQGRCAAWC